MTTPLTTRVFEELGRVTAGAQTPEVLTGALRLLAKWRASLIQNSVLKSGGTRVLGGVFEGLDFLPHSAEGCHVPKLLGCYEQPLQPAIRDAIARGYRQVVNIGCAEGYYAVGLARAMPGTRVLAYDVNPNAQTTCRALAAKNGVTAQVEVGALFRREDFAALAGTDTLVICDIEGAELQLLEPAAAPALGTLDLIVEAHDCFKPGLSAELVRRFSPTHDIQRIDDTGARTIDKPPPWFASLAHLDQLLAVWEWRTGPTPWLVMRARQKG